MNKRPNRDDISNIPVHPRCYSPAALFVSAPFFLSFFIHQNRNRGITLHMPHVLSRDFISPRIYFLFNHKQRMM